MLIYGNTPKDIKKMVFRNKTKVLLFAGAVVLAVALGTSGADADEVVILPEAKAQTNVVDTVKAVPSKVVEHISDEITDTKEYQAKSWAEAKAKWTSFKTKFLSN
jgi:hypothetical protein|tara:strand:+ start:803 stop:1117 length:315 start_codon:yes stop_codon:yes gene_type:complete